MVIFGCLGACLHWQSLGWKLSAGYLFIVIVGIGSILFHGTLQFQYQMWDEVPMIWTACYLFWLLLEEHGYKHVFYAAMMIVYCLLATILTSQSKGSLQFYLFQASFGLVMWSCFWFVWQMYRRAERKEIKSIFHQGVYYLIGAISVWLFDKNLCFVYKWIPNPQFHAWWHILVSNR
ncbi:hypothetical protein RMCBS344292_08270 [Rhizopus microsporus]|nr:hypothetical protein RMCBS344292_08270 [Rhizopus microsporus]